MRKISRLNKIYEKSSKILLVFRKPFKIKTRYKKKLPRKKCPLTYIFFYDADDCPLTLMHLGEGRRRGMLATGGIGVTQLATCYIMCKAQEV